MPLLGRVHAPHTKIVVSLGRIFRSAQFLLFYLGLCCSQTTNADVATFGRVARLFVKNIIPILMIQRHSYCALIIPKVQKYSKPILANI